MAFDMSQFMIRVVAGHKTYNPSESSLKPLIRLLENKRMFTATEKANIQKVVAFLTSDKRRRYEQALRYLGQSLNISISAIPCNPRMAFREFKIQTGMYVGLNSRGERKTVWLNPVDPPPDGALRLGPLYYFHTHRLSWSSSDGDVNSLANVLTREHVRFLADTQAPPFSRFADPDREFYLPADGQGSLGGSYNDDDHKTLIPAVACANPRTQGSLVAEQVYQYSVDNGTNWQDIEGAAYRLEKTVRPAGDGWVFSFKKTNWAPRNNVAFHFEVEYPIADPPDYLPASHEGLIKIKGSSYVGGIENYGRVISDI